MKGGGGDKSVALQAGSGGKNAQKHTEKKLIDKGLQRLDRYPRAAAAGSTRGRGPTAPSPASSRRCLLRAVDRKDPNYVNEEEEEEEVSGLVVGKVEVAKHGVARMDVDAELNV